VHVTAQENRFHAFRVADLPTSGIASPLRCLCRSGGMAELVVAKYLDFKILKNDYGCDWYRLWHDE
jgi:hypothetical protein